MEFYRFIIKLKKLNTDLKKVKATVNWRELSNITKLKSFWGFIITINALLLYS